MKALKKLAAAAAIVATMIMFSSCTVTRGFSLNVNDNLPKTSVVLSQSNYHVVAPVSGQSTVTYILGLSSLSYDSAKSSALAQMYQNANLKGSQAVVNVNIETSSKDVLGIVVKQTITATGTVVEFDK